MPRSLDGEFAILSVAAQAFSIAAMGELVGTFRQEESEFSDFGFSPQHWRGTPRDYRDWMDRSKTPPRYRPVSDSARHDSPSSEARLLVLAPAVLRCIPVTVSSLAIDSNNRLKSRPEQVPEVSEIHGRTRAYSTNRTLDCGEIAVRSRGYVVSMG